MVRQIHLKNIQFMSSKDLTMSIQKNSVIIYGKKVSYKPQAQIPKYWLREKTVELSAN